MYNNLDIAFKNANFGDRITHLMEINGYRPCERGANRRLSKAMHDQGIVLAGTNALDSEDSKDLIEKSIDNCRKVIDKHRKLEAPDIDCLWLRRYCKIFNCSADYLLGYIDAPTHENCSIQSITGFSEDTAAVLCRYNNEIKTAAQNDSVRADNEKKIIDILNYLIGSDLNKEIPTVHYDTNGNITGMGKRSEDYGILAYLHEYIMLGDVHHITGTSVIPEDHGKEVSIWGNKSALFTKDFDTPKESVSDLYRRTLKDRILSELDVLRDKYKHAQMEQDKKQ